MKMHPCTIRKPGHPEWNANSGDLHELLGLDRTADLPAEGMPEREIQGVRVYVKSKSDDPEVSRSRPHRVYCVCPMCEQHMSAGRLHQHVCKEPHA